MRIHFAAILLISLAMIGGLLLHASIASAATSRGIDITLKESEATHA